MFLYSSKGLFTIWAKVGTEEQHRGTQKTDVMKPKN